MEFFPFFFFLLLSPSREGDYSWRQVNTTVLQVPEISVPIVSGSHEKFPLTSGITGEAENI